MNTIQYSPLIGPYATGVSGVTAAICSCKTRRVAVYVETHYTIASKTAFTTDVFDR